MNSADDSSRTLEKKESAGKSAGITSLLLRNAKNLLAAGLLAFILSILALAPDIGFAATVDITSSQILTRGHPCINTPVSDCEHAASSCMCLVGYLHEGTVNVTFNPFLYPVNHLLASKVSGQFTRLTKAWGPGGDLRESIITQILISEFPINIPFFLVIGFILAAIVEKTVRKRFKRD